VRTKTAVSHRGRSQESINQQGISMKIKSESELGRRRLTQCLLATGSEAGVFLAMMASLCCSAHAFSEDGFHNGMNMDAVKTIIDRQASRLTGEHESNGFVSYVTDRGGFRQFTFCKGQLVGYSRTLSGFTEFNAVIERETKELGEGRYEASVHEHIGGEFAPPEEHNRAYSSLSFNWETPDGVTGVRIFEIRGPRVSFRDRPRVPGDWLLDTTTDFTQFWQSVKLC